jgi:hypothetical protein
MLPDEDSIDRAMETISDKSEDEIHQIAKAHILRGEIQEALAVLMAAEA